jgi:hypothetical protein
MEREEAQLYWKACSLSDPSLQYDCNLQDEFIFLNHEDVLNNMSIPGLFNGYLLSNGLAYNLVGKEIGRCEPSQFSYKERVENRLIMREAIEQAEEKRREAAFKKHTNILPHQPCNRSQVVSKLRTSLAHFGHPTKMCVGCEDVSWGSSGEGTNCKDCKGYVCLSCNPTKGNVVCEPCAFKRIALLI